MHSEQNTTGCMQARPVLCCMLRPHASVVLERLRRPALQSVPIDSLPCSDDFGFTKVMWTYSGRRGVHAWVCDEIPLQFGAAQRNAILQYLSPCKVCCVACACLVVHFGCKQDIAYAAGAKQGNQCKATVALLARVSGHAAQQSTGLRTAACGTWSLRCQFCLNQVC